AFQFFNGTGGGTNDAVAQSWGPALLGQPIAQASLTEPKRADVRLWLPQPDNVRNYFVAGRTLSTDVSAQAGDENGHFRLSAGNQSVTGLTPENSLSRQTANLTVGKTLTKQLTVDATGQFTH